MTEPADPPPLRHPAVYRTVRGLTLSGGRGAAGPVRMSVQPPVRGSDSLRVRRGADPDAVDAVDAGAASESVPVQDDATALYERRRYSEPND